MSNISRSDFLKMSAMGVVASTVTPRLWGRVLEETTAEDTELLQQLVNGNDRSVERYLDF